MAKLVVFVGEGLTFQCKTFQEVKSRMLSFINSNNVTVNQYYEVERRGEIYHLTKGPIACISYNGRIWQGTDLLAKNKKEILNLKTNDIDD